MGLDIGAVNTSTHHLPGLVGPPPTDEQSRDASGPWAAVGARPDASGPWEAPCPRKSTRLSNRFNTQSALNLFKSLVDFRGHGASQRPRTSTRHSLPWAGQAHVQGSLLWLNDFPLPPQIRKHPHPHLASKVQTFTNHLFFYLLAHLQNVKGGDSV